ncbi:MAG: glycosyltransferase family 4 protein [Anaerolineales bacterium]
MRVLMFSWEYPPHVVGGLGKHVMELAPALAEQGAEVHVVTPAWMGGAPEEHSGNLHVYRVAPPEGPFDDVHDAAERTNVRLGDVAEALVSGTGAFDIIHAHDWLVAFAGERLKHAHKTPLLATIHATEMGRNHGHLYNDLQQSIHSVEWWLTYEAWRVICCSQYMAWEVQTYFHVPADKIDVIPNGVDTAPFERWRDVDLADFRKRFALPHEKIVFYVGRVVYEKGVHVLLDAVPKVLAAFPDAKFVIAGTGAMLGDLRHRAQERGLSGKVLFTGFISEEDKNRLFALADCVVFPSLYEPFGIVALEAMASRAPVVVSSVGGLAEVVQHAETGITVYPGNAESLAWGILHTLQEPEWARQRAEAAYRMVKEQYNWRRIAEQTLGVYDRVVRERAQADW